MIYRCPYHNVSHSGCPNQHPVLDCTVVPDTHWTLVNTRVHMRARSEKRVLTNAVPITTRLNTSRAAETPDGQCKQRAETRTPRRVYTSLADSGRNDHGKASQAQGEAPKQLIPSIGTKSPIATRRRPPISGKHIKRSRNYDNQRS